MTLTFQEILTLCHLDLIKQPFRHYKQYNIITFDSLLILYFKLIHFTSRLPNQFVGESKYGLVVMAHQAIAKISMFILGKNLQTHLKMELFLM